MTETAKPSVLSRAFGPHVARFRSRVVLLWHPDSPGCRVPVRLTWYRRRPSGFATLGDTLRFYRSLELVEARRR